MMLLPEYTIENDVVKGLKLILEALANEGSCYCPNSEQVKPMPTERRLPRSEWSMALS